MALARWLRRSTRVVAVNPWWEYRCDEVTLPSGKDGEYHYVHTPGSVLVVPVLDDGRLVLVRQYRHLNARDSVEFPAGGMGRHSDAASAAAAELREEAGYAGGRFERIGSFNPINGVTDELCAVFVARDLRTVPPEPEETEEFEVLHCSAADIAAMIRSGELWDGMTLAAWSLYHLQSAPAPPES